MNEYKEKGLITFSVDMKHVDVNGKWKKQIKFPSNWISFTLENSYVNENMNSVALLTGKKNGIIVIDIDNVEHWERLLKENNEKEPETVKVRTGSGGIHYYFEYEKIGNTGLCHHCFGCEYEIDIKTDRGCVIAPPSKYLNKNKGEIVEYKWEKSIMESKIGKIPEWIKKLLSDKTK